MKFNNLNYPQSFLPTHILAFTLRMDVTCFYAPPIVLIKRFKNPFYNIFKLTIISTTSWHLKIISIWNTPLSRKSATLFARLNTFVHMCIRRQRCIVEKYNVTALNFVFLFNERDKSWMKEGRFYCRYSRITWRYEHCKHRRESVSCNYVFCRYSRFGACVKLINPVRAKTGHYGGLLTANKW